MLLAGGARVRASLGDDAPRPRSPRAAATLLPDAAALAGRLVARGFERVVYLGSNELRGLASEAALKLLELTDWADRRGCRNPCSASVTAPRRSSTVSMWSSGCRPTMAMRGPTIATCSPSLARDARAAAIVGVGAGFADVLGGVEGLEHEGMNGSE